MKALVYHGPGEKSLEDRPRPALQAPGDAIVRITKTTICGTDLHILKGDVPTCEPGRILGHEGVGIVEEVGTAVGAFKPGDHVLISCITSCARCEYCRRGMYSHCVEGGWILGNRIDGTQAEFVRIPHADNSLHAIPPGADEDALVMLSDILPTGYECGVLNGKVAPGSSVAIVGAGPIGLATLLTAQFYAPARIIMIDLDDNRLAVARKFGASALASVEKAEGVLADASANPMVVAADLMAQAEHDPLAACYLVTFDAAYADEVERMVERHLKSSTRAEITAASLADQVRMNPWR